MAENKFHSEVIDLPSEGRLYPKDSPLSSGKVELKYMTAREEDILTSANLIKKGKAIDTLLDSLIISNDFNCNDLVMGDKNAIMVAARVLAYGPEYTCEVTSPTTGQKVSRAFNLAECPFKKLPKNVKENKFQITLPISKKKITFKILTGKEEQMIEDELKSSKKLGSSVSPELTTRLRHTIKSINGDTNQANINNFANNILSRDSLHLRQEMKKVTPDIELVQKVEIGGDTVEVDIPMTVGFFWPNIKS